MEGLGRFARAVTGWTGSTPATVLAFSAVGLWFAGGLWFGYGTDYQMWINTGTTIVTFLMVFLIQRSQNQDNAAIQLKLDELIASSKEADNRLVDLESMSEEDVATVRAEYRRLAEIVKATDHRRGRVDVSNADSAAGRVDAGKDAG